jgi:hypothetical protein
MVLDDSRKRRKAGGAGDGGRRPLGLTVGTLLGGAVVLLAVLFALLILLGARPLAAQGLADFDYENLSFRGAALDVGYMVPSSRVESTASYGGRIDLGFLGPGVRVTTGFNRWSSYLTREEVGKLERQLDALMAEQAGDTIALPPVSLGTISWSDVAINTDAHLIWSVPFGVVTYAGLGATAHVLRGGGRAIEGTFVEDLLSTVRAGVNAHGGLEVPVHPRVRLVGEARYEVLEDLRYLHLRAGGQIMFGTWGQGATR